MITKCLCDQRDDIRYVSARLQPWHIGWHYLAGQFLAIVSIKAPLTARRLPVVVNKNTKSTTLQLVEIAHE